MIFIWGSYETNVGMNDDSIQRISYHPKVSLPRIYIVVLDTHVYVEQSQFTLQIKTAKPRQNLHSYSSNQ